MADELIKVAEDSARGSFFLISGSALATFIMAIASILIARFLGPELYGQYTLALVVPQLLFLFTDLGINQGIIKFTADFRLRNCTNRITKIIKYGLILRAITGIAISAINYAFADFFALTFLQRPDLAFYVRMAAISVLFQVILTTASSVFIGLDKTEYSALTANIQAFAKAIISISLVLLGFSVAGAIIGYIASYIVAAMVSLFILLPLTSGKKDNQDSNSCITDDFKTIMYYGAPLYISILLNGFIPLYQNVVLAIFTTDVDIGNYKAAINFISLITVLTVPITTALLPAFSKLNSSANQTIKTFYKLANKYIAVIIIPITFLLIVFSEEIVQIIYGSTYTSAPQFLATYCLLYFLVGFGYLVLPSLYNGLGQTKTTLKMSLITFIMIAILSPIFTAAYAVQGLIITYLIANAAGTSYGLYIARKNFAIEFNANILVKVYLNSAISSILSFLILHFARLPKLSNVIAGGFLFLFAYATLTPLTKTVTTSELQMLTHIIQRTRLLAVIAKPILAYQRRLLRIR